MDEFETSSPQKHLLKEACYSYEIIHKDVIYHRMVYRNGAFLSTLKLKSRVIKNKWQENRNLCPLIKLFYGSEIINFKSLLMIFGTY